MAPPIIVTEDTPPDMLAGSMDLTVVLPDGHSLKMSVERCTPMMDLLVQVTTANKMSPAGFIIKPLNERGPLPYKPSTPIGALDAWTIHIVPKQHAQCTAIKKSIKSLNQPFEQTFRLQVHLPRNQLYVARVSPKTRLADILHQVCSEKNLDPLKYSLRHPSKLDQVLSLAYTLEDYKLQEVTLVCNRRHPVEVSTVDIMSLQRETSNPAFRNTLCEGSVSSGSLEGRSLSPVPSDESSASPPPLPPSRPTRKRRPAPKPPTVNQKTVNEEKQQNGIQPSTVIYHSRNSSDSSGYHEASVLSESPQSNSVSESLSRHKMASVSEDPPSVTLSQSMTDVAAIEPPLKQATSYNSITSLSSSTGGRKKKTAPPPPPVAKNRTSSVNEDQQRTPSVSSTASSTTTLDGNEVNVAVKSATLPPSSRLNSVPKEFSPPSSPSPNTKVDIEPPTTPQGTDMGSSDVRMEDEEIDRIFTNATKNHTSLEYDKEAVHMMSLPPILPSPPSSLTHSELKQTTDSDDVLDWEYRLPAPPTFRDETKSPTVTEFGTVTIGNFTDILGSQSVNQDIQNKSDLEKIIEHPEKQKSVRSKLNAVNSTNNDLVQNTLPKEESRTNSIEFENNTSNEIRNDEFTVETVEKNVINELTSTFNQKPNKAEITDIEYKQLSQELTSSSTLENFRITTYKDTKPVEVFEDDSIKSSVGEKRDKSKDDAVFRAPKPRVKEPNLSRTSSFSLENNMNGPLIKRSVSYVSLLAANMPRNSQPYRAHLLRQNSFTSKDSQDLWPQIRKTISEVNIDNKSQDGKTKETSLWQDDTSELQSVQVLRSILNQSHANLASSPDESDKLTDLQHRDPPTSVQRSEDTYEKNIGGKKWGRSQSEGEAMWASKPKIEHSLSLDQEHSKIYNNTQRGPPSINLSTWSERPKRQISLKNDCDYTSGFGKKSIGQDGSTMGVDTKKDPVSTTKIIHSKNGSVRVELTTKNEGFKLEGRSKSVSDLSRIPIVRAVELKKPFVMHNFDRNSLKPVQIIDNINSITGKIESTSSDDMKNNNDDIFVGVNSLARKFGVQQKRPTSVYVVSDAKSNNLQTDVTESPNNLGSAVINNRNKLSSRNIVSKIDENSCRSNKKIDESNELHMKISGYHNKSDSATTEVKAQAKIRSGGFVENVPFVSSFIEPVSNLSDKKLASPITYLPKHEDQSSDINSYVHNGPVQNRSSITLLGDSKTPVSSNVSIPSNPSQRIVPSGVYIKQSQTLDRKIRPVNLQPVVKGFRMPKETPGLPKDLTSPSSPNTKDSRVIPSNLSNNKTNPVSSVHKNTYRRALSTPIISSDIKESTKEINTENVYSAPLTPTRVSKGRTQIGDVIPPPPPMLQMLKPVGDRKGVKLLPPPTALPRDLLMQSIRSFGKENLKRVSK